MRKPKQKPWLVTGCAGFIGSHLVEALLKSGHMVRGVDNLSSGRASNLKSALENSGKGSGGRFEFIEGDVQNSGLIQKACRGAQYVLHHAAQVSVPESAKNPSLTARVNVEGFVTTLKAAEKAGVGKFVYASSSSVYGSLAGDFHQESLTGPPLSPYAASKIAAESFAQALAMEGKIACVGLRYFNVYGPRQNPKGPYASVIPRWISSLKAGKPAMVFGDPQITRDFVYVSDVVASNLLAAKATGLASHEIFNIAQGVSISLGNLFSVIVSEFEKSGIEIRVKKFVLAPAREGDIKHSSAEICKAREKLGYSPAIKLEEGIRETIKRH